MSRIRVLGVLVAVVSMLATLNVAATAAGRGSQTAAEKRHQEVVDFWTVERVRQAKPRDAVIDPVSGAVTYGKPDDKPGGGGGGKPGGGGGGGGTTTTTDGASWLRDGDHILEDSVGKVLFAFGSNYYVCSASLVGTSSGKSAIMTAGHCVYDEALGVFADKWTYIPDYDYRAVSLDRDNKFCDGTELGCWPAVELTTTQGWTSRDFDFDVAFVRLGEGGKTEALRSITAAVPTSQHIFSSVTGSPFIHLFGYPASGKYKGTDLVYCAGQPEPDPWGDGGTHGVICNMTGGSSGGPWLDDFDSGSETGVAVGLNSYGYSGDKHMYGPIFGTWTADVFNEAVDTDYSATPNGVITHQVG